MNGMQKNQTFLIEEKHRFKSTLEERIQIGDELYFRKIQSPLDFDNFKTDMTAWDDYNSEYLKQSFSSTTSEYRGQYREAGFSLYSKEQDPIIRAKNAVKSKNEVLKRLVAKIELLKSKPQSETDTSSFHTKKSMHEVFIVHGHDEAARLKVARYIEKLGFQPIILNEQASSGTTIIEKIVEYSNVGFGIVIYTPCDVGGKKTSDIAYKDRARQNVVFEHGYLIGRIGRENVCALVKGDIETPNDISGVVYVSMDDSDAWQIKIARELKNSGYEVDMNKII
jgi:predicted nucleotide-binding protein